MFWLENLHHAATVMSERALELKYLFHEAEDAAVASVLRLSNSILNSEPESYRASLEEWKGRLSDPASTIIYLVVRPDSDRSLVASSEDRDDQSSRLERVPGQPSPVGFLFAYPRTHPEPLKDGSSRSLHIWLAGVLEEYRGRGCLGTMVNALIDLENRRPAGGSGELSTQMPMTICTSPSMFPLMWNWLRSRTRWVLEKEFDGGKVMFSLTGRGGVVQ